MDNSMIRFAIFLAVMAAFSVAFKLFFNGWRGEKLQIEEESPREKMRPARPEFKAPRPQSKIQQRLDAPEPDARMAKPPVGYGQPAKKRPSHVHTGVRHVQKSRVEREGRPNHRRPQRNSKPAAGRKIQL